MAIDHALFAQQQVQRYTAPRSSSSKRPKLGVSQDPDEYVNSVELDRYGRLSEASRGTDARTGEPLEPFNAELSKTAGVPEGLATAIGASFILGPAGILLGAAQGILSRRGQQNAMDDAVADAEARLNADAYAHLTFSEQRADAMNRFSIGEQTGNADWMARASRDLEQIDTFESQYAMASKMMESPFAETNAIGAQLMMEALKAQREYTVRNEAEMLADHQRDEDGVRDMGQEGYNRYKDSRDNFMAESKPYLEVRGASTNLLNALERGTPVDQYAAIKLLEKALDPSSVVRPEEQEAWGQLGSAFERAGVIFDNLKKGDTLSESQKQQIIELTVSIDEESYKMQQAREMRYADEITDIELPEKYHDNFRLAQPLEHISLMSDEELEAIANGR